ncbi:bromodomain-containing protein 8 [Athalia rosae]|uniref:bromodomain-containing protein 8 n=1 Tax=Athalia rosae TaxID=37344 RepID=UPI0020332C0A|nr:bromodomain-containing protein 8 [Athalia rosae]
MASVQDRLKLKRVPYDTWSTREQLCLAASVLNSGESVPNWKTVSESLKPFAEKEALRPPDWFSQKSCAIQYSHLLETADAPKRKKRESGDTQAETIVHRLTQERIAELKQILAFQRDEYQQLKAEVNLLRCGPLSDEKLQKMWQAIEQEEREQEQKARAHAAWLARRQQKQDSIISQSISMHRKSGEGSTETYDVIDPSNNEEDEKKRGGRSPLLTSLLKSPSPTTQIQSSSTPSQTGSPTIASLLVSSPKVPTSQVDRSLTQNVSSQLQQLVSTAIASVANERPSAGAPTLSMLLELPANPQRGPLLNLQTPPLVVSQPSIPPEIHTPLSTNVPTQTSSQHVQIVQAPSVTAAQNIPVTESMVQIIDHIDEVIRKDIMADVIDKDEINEIIGDIEELIKEEITASPRTKEPPVSTAVAETVALHQPMQESISERPEPRNVDEPASMSDSPESEMAIEDIDSSTSNIAEIIGTVAIESTETKIIVPPCEPSKVDEKLEIGEKEEDDESTTDESLPEEAQDFPENKEELVQEAESSFKAECKEPESNESTAQDTNDPENQARQDISLREINEDIVNEETELIEQEKDTILDSADDDKEASEKSEAKEEVEIDQLEIHLAEITGDPTDKSVEVAATSESSEATNDIASIEDVEKSQDISLILEEDESSQGSQNKEKAPSEEIIADVLDTSESCPEESTASTEEEEDLVVKVETIAIAVGEPGVNSKDDVLEKIDGERKEKAFKNSINVIVHQVDVKDDEDLSGGSGSDSNHSTVPDVAGVVREGKNPNERQPMKTEDSLTKEPKEVETVVKIDVEKKEEKIEVKPEVKEECNVVKEEIKTEDNDINEEKLESKETLDSELAVKKETAAGGIGDDVELDEEESTLSKLNGGRTMKTYSKRQVVTIDSEPENEAGGEGADYRAWKKAVMLVYNRLVTHKYASVFLRPITEDQAPGYHSVIFRPMDLSTIKKNIDNGTIRSTMHFQRDVMLMFQNAIMYNKQDTFVYKMAVSMQEECLQHMQILVQVTGEGPFRRETRTAASISSDFGESSTKPQRKRSHITPSPHDSDSPRTTKKRRKSEND